MDGPSNDNRMLSGSERVRARLIRALETRTAQAADPAGTAVSCAARPEAPAGLHARLERMARLRARRRELIGGDLFADPAWDILLTLLDSSLTGREESVSSACVAAAVPYSTALRWLNLLETRGWVERRPDRGDHRRILVRLTDKSRSALFRLFSEESI